MRKKDKNLDIDIDRLRKGWQYNGVEYTYDRSYCTGRRSCDGICRCTTLENVRVTDVNINTIAREICNGDNQVLNYCVNRILTHSSMKDADSWKVETSNGYYGEEVDDVTFNGTIPAEQLNELLACKDSSFGMIKTALVNEYGYMLPELEVVSQFVIQEVALDSISIGNTQHYRRLDKKIVNSYKDFDLPLAICIPAGDGFRLIDGYHRIAAAKADNKKTVKVIIGITEDA